MKRTTLILLSALLVIGLASCSSSEKKYDLVGTWLLSWDWDCNGADGQVVQHFEKDGTWYDDSYHGTWTVEKKNVTIRYTSGTVYSGMFEDDDNISGTMRDFQNYTGCWSSVRTSKTP